MYPLAGPIGRADGGYVVCPEAAALSRPVRGPDNYPTVSILTHTHLTVFVRKPARGQETSLTPESVQHQREYDDESGLHKGVLR
jgi:hypothetical protein